MKLMGNLRPRFSVFALLFLVAVSALLCWANLRRRMTVHEPPVLQGSWVAVDVVSGWPISHRGRSLPSEPANLGLLGAKLHLLPLGPVQFPRLAANVFVAMLILVVSSCAIGITSRLSRRPSIASSVVRECAD